MFFGFGNRRADPSPPPVAASGAEPVLQRSPPVPDKKTRVSGNKRDDERVPVERVEGEVMVFQPMTVLDISPGGAQIETSFALQLDSLHDFRLTLGSRSVVVKGRIAHCHIGQLTDVAAVYRTGVEFVDLTEPVRDAIADFVVAMKYSHPAPSIVDGIVTDDDDGDER